MVEVNWTSQSIEDINNIAEFISRDPLKYAEVQVEQFFEYAAMLELNPQIGRVVPEVGNKAIREMIIGNYRLIYKIIERNRIDILTVHHSSRLLKNSNIFKRK